MLGNQIARNDSVAVSGTSTEVLHKVAPGLKRIDYTITNISAAAVVTLAKGEVAAVAGKGQRLIVNAASYASSDNGYKCWQDAIQAVADVAGTVGVTETLEELR